MLRGFALLGIALVNLPWFSQSIYATPEWPDLDDRWAATLVAAFFHAKFFVIFSFVFGYGLAIQMRRADERGVGLFFPYARRIFGLFALGVIHVVFFFIGDILMLYAVLGIPLWFGRRLPIPWLLGIAGAMMLLAALSFGLFGFLTGIPFQDPSLTALDERATKAFRGSFLDAARERVSTLPIMAVITLLINGPLSAAMFALGLAGGRAQVIENFDKHRPLVRKFLPIPLIIAIVGNAAYAVANYFFVTPGDMGWGWWAALAGALVVGLVSFAAPCLSFCYVALLLRLEQSGRFEALFTPLRLAGRMSLSNYLGQSVLASALFGRWGLGFFGSADPVFCVAAAIAIYAVMVGLSALWLQRFRIGPMEWLLRSWTHFKLMPLRRG